VPVFRNLLIADGISDIGTFMQSVGAAWLMVSFGAGPLYVALTQTRLRALRMSSADTKVQWTITL
jgi:Transmembrane secretion effector